jgi:protein involved in polysaccharide export with SLBB domain
VLRAFSAVDSALPVQRQNKRVRVEGEVLRPGEYVLPPESSIADALAAAGGLTDKAYPFGTEFNRESVRRTQQQNYERALRDLETDLARNTSAQRTRQRRRGRGSQPLATRPMRASSAALRGQRPTGRIVLQMEPTSRELPPLALEDGDRLFVPATTDGGGRVRQRLQRRQLPVRRGRALDDYLNLAGGPTRGADAGQHLRDPSNGSVVSVLQQGSWLRRGTALSRVKAEAGDTVFVPEEMNKTTFIQSAKDWTQILAQFGLGVAAINSLK